MLHGYGAAGGAYKRGRSAGRSGPSATKNAAQEGDGKAQFSLKRTKDGRPYVDVDVDQHLFDGLTTAQMQEKAKNIIKDRFKGTQLWASPCSAHTQEPSHDAFPESTPEQTLQ